MPQTRCHAPAPSNRTWDGPSWSAANNLGGLLLSIQSLFCEEALCNEPGYGKVGRGGPGYDKECYGGPGYDNIGYVGPRYDKVGYGGPGYFKVGYVGPGYDKVGYGGPGNDKGVHTLSGRTGSAFVWHTFPWTRVRAPVATASLAICRPRLHRAIRGAQGVLPMREGCDQSIGSTISDAIVQSWLWSTATRSTQFGLLR